MPSVSDVGQREHNLAITVVDDSAAARMVERLRQAGVPADAITVDTEPDRRRALPGEAHENEGHMAGPAVPAAARTVRGAGFGILVGAPLGAFLLLPMAVFDFRGLDLAVRLAVTGIAGAVAGSVAGAVFFGARRARRVRSRRGEPHSRRGGGRAVGGAERGVVVAVHTDDPRIAMRSDRAAWTADPLRVDWTDRTRKPVTGDDVPLRDTGTTVRK